MARKKVAVVAAAASTAILVAVGELSGGGVKLASGEELTEEKAEAIGLDADAIADLVDRGKLAKIDVRQAESRDAHELAAAIARANEADEVVAALTAEVADLKAKLAEATKPKA